MTQDRDAERPVRHLTSVTNTGKNRDAKGTRRVSIVTDTGGIRDDEPATMPAELRASLRKNRDEAARRTGPTSAAERARRYRARKRGEDVPKRKPGPPPLPASALRARILDLERQLAQAQLMRGLAEKRRRPSLAVTVVDLLTLLDASDGRRDSPEVQVKLRDVRAAIEARQDLWPEPVTPRSPGP